MNKKNIPLKYRIYRIYKNLIMSIKRKRQNKYSNRFSKVTTRYTMQWGGVNREYYVYVPVRYDEAEQQPLYIGLHGLTGDASTLVSSSLFPILCDLNGGILAFPQGLEDICVTGWNAGVEHFLDGKIHQLHKDYDDVGFINGMIDELVLNFNIDKTRIYVFGFSMGGFMINRLAIECGHRFRAMCSIDGTIGNMLWKKTPKYPVNILHIHGTLDKSVEYNPTPSKHHKPHGIGAEQLVEYWRTYNQCNFEPVITDYPHVTDNNITFQLREYNGGNNGAKTAFIKAVNGEHTWYDRRGFDISYTVEIMRFFKNAPWLNNTPNHSE